MNARSSCNVTTAGFWLPCGRANFFDPDEDQPLRETSNLVGIDLTLDRLAQTNDTEALESSVSRRLVTVLSEKGYSRAFWLLPTVRLGYKDDSDPEAVVLICEYPTGWPQKVDIKGLVLLVNDDGFYLWVAIYDNDSEEEVQDALKKYIAELIGGNFFSRFSGKETVNVDHYVADYEREATLMQYRDKHIGILNFFQLNLILEGIYNSTFHPEVFFSQDFQSPELREIKEKYTLGSFAKLITVPILLEHIIEREQDQKLSVAENILTLFEECISDNQRLEKNLLARRLLERCLTDITRRDILRQFLRMTSTKTLRHLKWYIERCRRSLLTEMIGITHRRQPLLQAESPDKGTNHIAEANEAQVRGYVMLIAAKLPLITNVQRYMKDAMRTICKDVRRDLSSLDFNWNALIEAISDNLEKLEQAIEQARMDRLLYEEEQVRAEQETMAEIERIRERTLNTLSEMDSTAIGVVANLIAILAFSITVVTFGSTTISGKVLQFFQFITQWVKISHVLQVILLMLVILVGLFLLILLYMGIVVLFQALIGKAIRGLRVLLHTRLGLGHRYYYEMDMRLDAPIHVELAEMLFRADFDEALGRPTGKASNTATGISVAGEGNGFKFTVPADPISRTLKVYIGVCQAQGELKASLSDNSASDYNDASLSNPNGTTNRCYVLTYKARSKRQILTVTFTMLSESGNVTLQAATLADGSSDGNNDGSLTGSIEVPVSTNTVNLTREGTSDWTHWGLNTEKSFDHKTRGGLKISNYRLIGSSKVSRYLNSSNGYTWKDGTQLSKLERNSYRVERTSEDEALHKVHIETNITWPRKGLSWLPIYGSRAMKCFLTYELLFHRPSKANDYVLRELRVVSMYDKILSPQQLGDLKRIIIEKFINCWLEKNFKLSDDPTEEPLLALTPVEIKPSTTTNPHSNRLQQLRRILRP